MKQKHIINCIKGSDCNKKNNKKITYNTIENEMKKLDELLEGNIFLNG